MSTWRKVVDCLPDQTAHDKFVVWNGRWRALASWLMTADGPRFCDYTGTPIKGVTHWFEHDEVPGKD